MKNLGVIAHDSCPRCGRCWTHSLDNLGPCSLCKLREQEASKRIAKKRNITLNVITKLLTCLRCGEEITLSGKYLALETKQESKRHAKECKVDRKSKQGWLSIVTGTGGLSKVD